MTFCWHADDDPLLVVFGSSPLIVKKQQQKTPMELDPLWQNFLYLRMSFDPMGEFDQTDIGTLVGGRMK